jgi:hypothetical protein
MTIASVAVVVALSLWVALNGICETYGIYID